MPRVLAAAVKSDSGGPVVLSRPAIADSKVLFDMVTVWTRF